MCIWACQYIGIGGIHAEAIARLDVAMQYVGNSNVGAE